MAKAPVLLFSSGGGSGWGRPFYILCGMEDKCSSLLDLLFFSQDLRDLLFGIEDTNLLGRR